MRGDETVLALGHFAGPAGNHFTVGDEHAARRLPAVVHLGLPTDRSSLGIEGDQEAVRRGKIDHVLIDADVLVTRRLRIDALGVIALILPDQVAIGAVGRLHRGAGHIHIDNAAIDDWRGFLGASRQTARPGHTELPDVVLVDLVERAIAPRIERPPPK